MLEIKGARIRLDGESTVRVTEVVKTASLEVLVAEHLLVVARIMCGQGRNGLGRAENWVNVRLRIVEGSSVCLRSVHEPFSDQAAVERTIWLLLIFSSLRLCKCPMAPGSTVSWFPPAKWLSDMSTSPRSVRKARRLKKVRFDISNRALGNLKDVSRRLLR